MNRALYPPHWEEISLAARARAGNRCQFCGVENGALGWRERGKFVEFREFIEGKYPHPIAVSKIMKIVLTVAHLDHDPANCADENLRALCQQCHLRYDVDHHARNAALTRHRKKIDAGQLPLQLS